MVLKKSEILYDRVSHIYTVISEQQIMDIPPINTATRERTQTNAQTPIVRDLCRDQNIVYKLLFDFLTLREIFALGKACRHLWGIVKHYPTHIERIDSIKAPQIRHPKFQVSCLIKYMNRCLNLKTIDLSEKSTQRVVVDDLNHSVQQKKREGFQEIEKIECILGELILNIPTFKRLTSLNIHANYITDEGLGSFDFPFLTSLNLSDTKYVSGYGFKNCKLPELRAIDFSDSCIKSCNFCYFNFPKIDTLKLSGIPLYLKSTDLNIFPTLTHLDIANTMTRGSDLSALNLPALTFLEISQNSSISLQDLQKCDLPSLSIIHSRGFDFSNGLNHSVDFEKITAIDFSHADNLSEISNIALPSLTSLTCENSKMTLGLLQKFEAPSLLHFSTTFATIDNLSQIPQLFPKLKTLILKDSDLDNSETCQFSQLEVLNLNHSAVKTPSKIFHPISSNSLTQLSLVKTRNLKFKHFSCPNLKGLRLVFTFEYKDKLEGLKEFSQLEFLNLSCTFLHKPQTLNLPMLQYLDFSRPENKLDLLNILNTPLLSKVALPLEYWSETKRDWVYEDRSNWDAIKRDLKIRFPELYHITYKPFTAEEIPLRFRHCN